MMGISHVNVMGGYARSLQICRLVQRCDEPRPLPDHPMGVQMSLQFVLRARPIEEIFRLQMPQIQLVGSHLRNDEKAAPFAASKFNPNTVHGNRKFHSKTAENAK